MKVVHSTILFDGWSWPNVDHCNVSWALDALRYGTPDKNQLLTAASICDALNYLTSSAITTELAIEKLRKIRKARAVIAKEESK